MAHGWKEFALPLALGAGPGRTDAPSSGAQRRCYSAPQSELGLRCAVALCFQSRFTPPGPPALQRSAPDLPLPISAPSDFGRADSHRFEIRIRKHELRVPTTTAIVAQSK